MALILNIDTAMELASICLSDEKEVLSFSENRDQKDHAGWLQPAIKQVMDDAGFSLSELAAIAVTSGPGSYTGLRVGLSSAKGLCFALKLPLITVNTLEAMAQAVPSEAAALRCPMIDARRMEVFTAIYDDAMNEV